MKPIHHFRMLTLLAAVGLIYACNKNTASTPGSSSNTNTELQTQADDQAQVSSEDEAVSNDANTVLYSAPGISGTSAQTSMSATTEVNGTTQANGVAGFPLNGLICDATVVVDTTGSTRNITITYNGTNCQGNRTRTGVVVLSMPLGQHWTDAGATVTASIQNLVITRLRDNKTITLNGTKTFTNVSGGLVKNLATVGTITHTVSGSLSITFEDGSTRIWNVAKQRVFTYDNGIVITTTGTHADSLGNSNVAEWGVNRNDVGFESLISAPKVIRQDCDFRLVSGQNQILRTDNITTQITYGLDANGDPTGCPGSGTYYMKVVITRPSGVTITKILPY